MLTDLDIFMLTIGFVFCVVGIITSIGREDA